VLNTCFVDASQSTSDRYREFTSVSMEENAVGYYLTRDAMRWFYDHYLEDPSQGDDPRVSPLREVLVTVSFVARTRKMSRGLSGPAPVS